MASKRDLGGEISLTNLFYSLDVDTAASAILSFPIEEIDELTAN